jgi:hypothetical protein
MTGMASAHTGSALYAGLLLHVACDLLARREPDTGLALHVLKQAVQVDDSRPHADDVWVDVRTVIMPSSYATSNSSRNVSNTSSGEGSRPGHVRAEVKNR